MEIIKVDRGRDQDPGKECGGGGIVWIEEVREEDWGGARG